MAGFCPLYGRASPDPPPIAHSGSRGPRHCIEFHTFPTEWDSALIHAQQTPISVRDRIKSPGPVIGATRTGEISARSCGDVRSEEKLPDPAGMDGRAGPGISRAARRLGGYGAQGWLIIVNLAQKHPQNRSLFGRKRPSCRVSSFAAQKIPGRSSRSF